jgi:hypothetical protein
MKFTIIISYELDGYEKWSKKYEVDFDEKEKVLDKVVEFAEKENEYGLGWDKTTIKIEKN